MRWYIPREICPAIITRFCVVRTWTGEGARKGCGHTKGRGRQRRERGIGTCDYILLGTPHSCTRLLYGITYRETWLGVPHLAEQRLQVAQRGLGKEQHGLLRVRGVACQQWQDVPVHHMTVGRTSVQQIFDHHIWCVICVGVVKPISLLLMSGVIFRPFSPNCFLHISPPPYLISSTLFQFSSSAASL